MSLVKKVQTSYQCVVMYYPCLKYNSNLKFLRNIFNTLLISEFYKYIEGKKKKKDPKNEVFNLILLLPRFFNEQGENMTKNLVIFFSKDTI